MTSQIQTFNFSKFNSQVVCGIVRQKKKKIRFRNIFLNIDGLFITKNMQMKSLFDYKFIHDPFLFACEMYHHSKTFFG